MPGKSRKIGRRSSLGKNRKYKKTMRTRVKKYKKGMRGGNPPKKPVKGPNPNPNPVIVQGTNLGPVLAQEQTRVQTGQRDLSGEINSE